MIDAAVTPQPASQPAPLDIALFEDLRRALLRAGVRLDDSAPAPVYLDAENRRRFLEASRVERHNTEPYVRDQERYLTWWSAQLADVDLRRLSLATDVVPKLEHARARGARIAALKAFTSWLTRDRHVLERDPCGALKVPQARPAQWRRSKVVASDLLEATICELEESHQDEVEVLLGTGWHVTELSRFARSGSVLEPTTPDQRRRRVAGVLETRHKHGEPFLTCVSKRVRAAAERVRARGDACPSSLYKALRRACVRARLPRWTAGQLRHTVATWAVTRGEDFAAVAAFLNHRDARTTRRWYAVYVAPRKVRTPR